LRRLSFPHIVWLINFIKQLTTCQFNNYCQLLISLYPDPGKLMFFLNQWTSGILNLLTAVPGCEHTGRSSCRLCGAIIKVDWPIPIFEKN
jgi:hypothetical protein